MRFSAFLSFSCLLLIVAIASPAEPLPAGNVQLQPARWRTVRQVIQACAEQTDFRWAMPETISRRAWTGTSAKKDLPAAEVLRDLCMQTGLTAERINNILVFHVPQEMKRKELTAQLAGPDARAARQSICELGWMRDARAWPILAQAVAGADLERALAAAHALRRLEGDKALDWRLHGVTNEDPDFIPMTEPVASWQVPLGSAFPEAIAFDAIERLAASSYLPLREAAARLAACHKTKGKGLVAKLAGDPSPLVRAAAERTLVAWAEPKPGQREPSKRNDGSKPWWELPSPDLKAAAEELAQNKDHDTVWRLTGRRVAYQGTPQAIQVMLDYGKSGGRWSGHVSHALAEWCGGPDVIAWLKQAAASGDTMYGGHQGWAMWGLTALQDGPELAQSLRPALAARSHWAAPPEFTAARGAGIHALKPILDRMDTRGHWVCVALGYIGGPDAIDALLAHVDGKDPGVASAAAKALGDTAALAGVRSLITQLKHPDRLRRHWAVLGLGRIGGPDAAQALTELLVVEEKRQDRLVRKAAVQLLREMGPLGTEAQRLAARADADDAALVPEYRPRNPKFDARFPVNTEIVVKEHRPITYSSIGETRAALDWANRLLVRYGGCTPCYSNECFAFDIGTATWFPIRAADHYCHLFNEVRSNPGCSRGMTYDGLNKWIWIGQGIGSSTGPTAVTHNRSNGLSTYDAALDRFYPCANGAAMAKAYSGEPAKYFAFDYDQGRVISSASGGKGISVLDVKTRKTSLEKAPEAMPSWDQYRPPAFAWDPISKRLLCTHPDLGWKLLTYDFGANAFRLSDMVVPGNPSKQVMGGLVYDSLSREMLLIGGVTRDSKQVMPTCRYDRQAERWIDLKTNELGKMGTGQGTCVYDPEHNIVLEVISGAVYRYQTVAEGRHAFYGEAIGKRE
jgi:hypothetical protein